VGAVGLYSFGYQIAEILNALLVNPVKEGIMPHIYKMEKEPEDQKAFIKSSALYYYVVAMFFALGLSLYARELVMLLARREEFWPSWEIIPIISLCCVFHGLGNFLGLGMVMRSKTALFSATVIVSAMVNIGLNFVLIPTFGLVGAAMATLMSYFIWNGLKSYYSFKFYHLCFDFRRLGSITLVGVILYFVSVVLANTGSFSLNLFIKALILSVYPLTFFMTSFFTLDEKNFIQNFWTNLTRAR